MALGPKLYTKLVLPPKCYFCFVKLYFLAGYAAFVVLYAVAVSSHDLKHFSKSDLLRFAGGVFMDFCPQRATKTPVFTGVFYNHEIYDIGTKILYETCFTTKIFFLFVNPFF